MTAHTDKTTTDESTDESTDGAADTPAAAKTPAIELEKDVIFEILKNQRRRRVVQYLREHGDTELGDLAESIAAEENETTVAQLSSEERKRVYIGLYQTHLPKMDDAGVVAYDQSRGTVSTGSAIDQLYPYLETRDDGGDEAKSSQASIPSVDLSGFGESVTLPAWGLLATLLAVGLIAVAGTALPGPLWAGILVAVALVATWAVRWQ